MGKDKNQSEDYQSDKKDKIKLDDHKSDKKEKSDKKDKTKLDNHKSDKKDKKDKKRFDDDAFLFINGRLLPVSVRQDVYWDDLIGIERQKEALLKNTEAFLNGQAYQQVLLWGARGTGKSSLVRALYWRYAERLKIVQVAPDDVVELAYLFSLMARQEALFLVVIDDLAFHHEDQSYRVLKSVLDGAITGIPKNICLLVTSNRRHLLAERFQDERSIHPEEDTEEQVSLAERFGLRLAFHPLNQDEYLAVVANGLGELSEDQKRSALQFALARGSRSARVASQFIQMQDDD